MFRFGGSRELDRVLNDSATDAYFSDQVAALRKLTAELIEALSAEADQWKTESDYLETIDFDDAADGGTHRFYTASVRNHTQDLRDKVGAFRVDARKAGLDI